MWRIRHTAQRAPYTPLRLAKNHRLSTSTLKPSSATRAPLAAAAAAAAAVAATAATLTLADAAADEYDAVAETQLPRAYDPVAIAHVWGAHPRCALARLAQVAYSSAPLLARLAADGMRSAVGPRASAEDLAALHTERALQLRALLISLGPTFIKFGQMLSIRPDVMPPAAIEVLRTLCDAVPSYPTPLAIRLIESELGRPVSEVFDGLDETTEPVAAASLGQVYRVRLRVDGVDVALKVQRPDIVRAVSLDLYLLRRYCTFVEWFKSEVLTGLLGAAERASFDVALLDTFARASYLELDYVNEGLNLEVFEKQLVPRLDGAVRVPRCFWSATTRKVLATEWIHGKPLALSSPETIQRLTPVGVDCFLRQLLEVGFFHSDPHAGNLLVDEEGRLVLIDFGLCAEIEAFDSSGLTSAIVHLMRGDVEALVEDAVSLRFLPADVDRDSLLPPLRSIFEKSRLAAAERSPRSGGGAVAARRAQFGAVSRELNAVFFEFPFVVPEYFALITRALIVLEGIALTGDPDFDLFDAAYPYARKHAARLFGWNELATMLGEAKQAAARLQQQGSEARDVGRAASTDAPLLNGSAVLRRRSSL